MSFPSILICILLFTPTLCFAILNTNPTPPKILVVGGNGRVGGSTARHIHILSEGKVELLLGGRSQSSFEASKSRIISQLRDASISIPRITFQPLNLDNNVESLEKTIRACGAQAIVNTAGPFQQRTEITLLEACIGAGIPYVDVCDEPSLCESGRRLRGFAAEKGVVAVTGAGIWPGSSALMAARAVDEVRRVDELDSNKGEVDITMSFFTAGTGNAGATIVSATFLLLCQKALVVRGGREVELEPWTEETNVDFRGREGVRTVRLLDNPDVFTLYRSIEGVNSLCSRFATAPGVWNQLFGAMKSIVPRDILSNTDIMQGLSLFSLPIIRLVDKLVGATNSMRVDVNNLETGRKCTFIVTHDDLEQCVGLATASFILELIEPTGDDSIKPGVYYPAELPKKSRERVLERVKRDSVVWEFETSD